jgi:hypothetical protein
VTAAPSPRDGERFGTEPVLDVDKGCDLVGTIAGEALDTGAALGDARMDRGEAGADLLGGRQRGDA